MTAMQACVGASLLANLGCAIARIGEQASGCVREQARSYEDAARLTRLEGTP